MTQPQTNEQILVVDDDEVSLDLVATNLAAAGYVPLTADNGIKALEIVHERQPRIVISDWLMPKMDGLEVCRQVRSIHDSCLIYFIMLTVQSDKSRLMEAFDVGVDDFLSKPFHRGELLARVRAGVRMVRMYDELEERTRALSRTNSELSRLNERLRQTASTDELTKLLNRRQAMMRLREEWAIADRYDQPLSCAMVDIDHFKRVNDNYGHLKGDEILQRIATILSQSVRASDGVYRIGGEEFLMLFPMQTTQGASLSAERCRTRVESSVAASGLLRDPVTISVGVAQKDSSMKGPDDFLRAADACLYAAKNQGRNQMVIHALAG